MMSWLWWVAIVGLIAGQLGWYRYRRPARSQWSRAAIGKAPLGLPCRLVGRVRLIDGRHECSPVRTATCVAWELRIQEYPARGDTIFALREGSSVPFEVFDETGTVLVAPTGRSEQLTLKPALDRFIGTSETLDVYERLQRYGGCHGYRWSETVIVEGERVALYGVCRRLGNALVLEPDERSGAMLIERLEEPREVFES